MASIRKKQDDNKILKALREIVSTGSNRNCFDCGQKGVTYVNSTIGSFVCTSCSGILRGLTPPHRVKSISMATFTAEEIEFLKNHGNDECAKTWLGLWDPKRSARPPKQDHREFMVDKYERKRYYLEKASPLKSITQNSNSNTTMTTMSAQIQQDSNLAALKAISLTPPTSNRQHHRTQHNSSNNQNNNLLNSSNFNNNISGVKFQQQFSSDDQMNFFNQTTSASSITTTTTSTTTNINKLNNTNSSNINNNSQLVTINGTSNGCRNENINNNNNNNNKKSLEQQDFVADFSNANIYNSTNSLNSNGSSGHHNKVPNGNTSSNANGDLNANFANFADFENNQIYNAAVKIEDLYNKLKSSNKTINNNAYNNTNNNIQWNIWQNYQPEQNRWSLPMSVSSLSNNSLNSSSNGTFTSNSSLNSTPQVDRYAALKDLDEQFREIKSSEKTKVEAETVATTPSTNQINPFKTVNPFQQQSAQSQSYQNWTIPEQSPNPMLMNGQGFGSPMNTNGLNNGYFYNNNLSNMNQSAFGQQKVGNPFMTGATMTSNNPFL